MSKKKIEIIVGIASTIIIIIVGIILFIVLTKHTHEYEWYYNEDEHWQACACDKERYRGSHDWKESSKIDSTEESLGEINYKCEICNREKKEDIPLKEHIHTFDKKVISEMYLATTGNCATASTYFYSCRCGEKNHDIFEGNPNDLHEYGEVLYTWSSDYSKCTATRTCLRDASHIENETVNVKCVTTNASCLTSGKVIYTSLSFVNSSFEIQSKEIILKQLEHNYGKWIEEVPATCNSNGIYGHYHCSNCGKNFNSLKNELLSLVINAGHKWDNGVISSPASPTQEGTKLFTCTGCNTTYTESFAYVPHVTVTFVDYDNSIIDVQEIEIGKDAIDPSNRVERNNYRFIGWDKPLNAVIEDITVTAIYIRQYSVTFVDYDGSEILTKKVDMNSACELPDEPTRTGYSFIGWDTELSNVLKDLKVNALYEVNKYEVKFVYPNGEIIKIEEVVYSLNATEPVISEYYFDWNTMKAYSYSGWDKEFNSVSDNMVITALYNDLVTKPVLAIQPVNVNKGTKTVEVGIYLLINNPIYGLNLSIDYDEKLMLDQKDVIVENSFNAFNSYSLQVDKTSSSLEFIWSSGSSINSLNYIPVLTLQFKLDQFTAVGNYLVDILSDSYLVGESLTKEELVIISNSVIINE